MILLILILIILYLYLLRSIMIKKILNIKKTDTETFINSLQNGDIIFTCITNYYLEDLYGIHSVLSNMIMNTPFYHVYIVVELDGIKYFLHCTKFNFNKKVKKMCNKDFPWFEIDSIKSFLQSIQKYECIFKVFRNSSIKNTNIYELALNNFCQYTFIHRIYLFLEYLFNKNFTTSTLHCNSYVGLILEKLNLLEPISNVNSEYIPSKLINIYLPKARFHEIGVYKLIS